MQLTVNLDAYSGPLDLLLDLISKQKVDIYDIEISKITKHYLEAIENSVYSEDTDISAFLLMSSTLVEIKSRSLIPKNTDEDEDEIVTKEQLIEHDEQLVDTLTAISVISKQLAKKIKEDEQYEQNETTE